MRKIIVFSIISVMFYSFSYSVKPNKIFHRLQGREISGRRIKFFKGHDFSNQYLRSADFRDCIFENVSFRNADLTEVLLDGASLINVALEGAILYYLLDIFGRPKMENALQIKMSYSVRARYENSDGFLIALYDDLKNKIRMGRDKGHEEIRTKKISCLNKLFGSLQFNLKNNRLHNINLGGADLRGAYLNGANLLDANLIRTHLSEACVSDNMILPINSSDEKLIEFYNSCMDSEAKKILKQILDAKKIFISE